MSITGKIGLPELASSQAAKEETVNEIARGLEAFASLCSIEDRDLTAPPGSCADGACYLVKATATGSWTGSAGKIAVAMGANASNGWAFYSVFEGLALWVKDEDLFLVHNGSAFAQPPLTLALDDLSDVDAAAPVNGDVLTWDESAGDWIPAPAPGSGGGSGGTVPSGGAEGEVLRKASGVDYDVEWADAGLQLISSTTASGNTSLTNLGGYKELFLVCRDLTQGSAGFRFVQLSTNNGSTWLGASGDYKTVGSTGGTTNLTDIAGHSSSQTTGSLMLRIFGNIAGGTKMFQSIDKGQGFVANSGAISGVINAIGIFGTVTITGGKIDLYGR